MWLMLQQDEPGDYVIATGEAHSVREFAELAFAHAGLDWQQYVREDPSLCRPAEVDQLIGDATKARTVLGWQPEVSFPELVRHDGRRRHRRLLERAPDGGARLTDPPPQGRSGSTMLARRRLCLVAMLRLAGF